MDPKALTILLVEENGSDASLLKRALSETGQSVTIVAARSFSAALEALKTQSFDAVLLNLFLQDSRGIATLSKFRKINDVLPVVIFADLNDEQLAIKAVRNGAEDYLIKGFPSGESIYRCLRYAIERKNAQEAKRQLSLLEQREYFMTMLAHDLKMPLTGTQRVLTLLRDGLLGDIDSEHKSLLSQIISSNKTLLLTIENVLDANRASSGRQKCQVVETNLNSIIIETIHDVQILADSKQIKIVSELLFDGPVYADPYAIKRVLSNLLSNAIKFTPSKGQVEIAWTKHNDDACLSIKDSGVGIEPTRLTKIFEAPEKVVDRKNRTPGLGLGLMLCKLLMEAQGGTIDCQSQLDSGTVIKITLRLPKASITPAAVTSDATAG